MASRSPTAPMPVSYRMPAEFEPHAATWIAWPHLGADWPGKMPVIRFLYVQIVRALVRGEIARIIVRDAAAERRVRRMLRDAHVPPSGVEFFRVRTNRGWTRDFGPNFVRRGRALAIVDWKFNGWAKYRNWKLDDAVSATLAKRLRLPLLKPRIDGSAVVLEGGSIDVNGRGTLLTTEECLLSPTQARNPALSRSQMEEILHTYLGASHVLWLGRGIAGDDTHGHVDDVARFVDPRTVVAAVETDRRDENFAPLADNLARLRRMRDQDGRRLDVIELPMPEPVVFRGQRLPASYANFYIANRAVLVPVFNDPHDRIALDALASALPTREVIPIQATDLVWGLGTLHCLTQQQPQG
jgi:agmatine deiminase